MINIQGPGSLKKIFGLTSSGQVQKIPDLLFARKHLTNPKEEKYIRKINNLFAFVSSPKIYKDHSVITKSRGWCHALRNPELVLPFGKPKTLLPESDFMDANFIKMAPRAKSFKYDFFYYTLNARAGIEHKGLRFFLRCLPMLCGKCKLRGLVIVYFPNVPRMRRLKYIKEPEVRILERHQDRLTFRWGKLDDHQMADIASKTRFGFFPNEVDNSPRTITETLIRDVPVLVNKKIHGGWHYINEHTGHLFNIKNLENKIELLRKETYNPREYFMSNYGFERSSRKLASFVQKYVKLDTLYTHMYFNNYKHFLERMVPNV